MRWIVAILLNAAAAFAQKAVTADQLPAAVTRFEGGDGHAPLPCSVEPVKPSLNFDFRFQTGYVLRMSLDPYRSGPHHWYIVFRVTAEGSTAKPVYFLDTIDLPAALLPDFTAESSGTFFVGEGHYDVKWSLLDDLGRVCRQEWTLDARPSGTQRSEKIAMPPGVAGDFAWRPAPVASAVSPNRRVTVLLNAALPVATRARGAQTSVDGSYASQWETLLSILGSLIDQMPGASVRLVAFNLDQQREILRQDHFTSGDVNNVARFADGIEQWAVDYKVLLKPSGGWDLLSAIESQEIHAAQPSDSVIFLGLPGASPEKIPAGMPQAGSGRVPHFFYLRYGSVIPIARAGMNPPGRGAAQGPNLEARGRGGGAMPLPPPPLSSEMVESDPIEQTVRRMKGKTITISSPTDFGKAIKSIQR